MRTGSTMLRSTMAGSRRAESRREGSRGQGGRVKSFFRDKSGIFPSKIGQCLKYSIFE